RDFHVTGVQTCALPISPREEGAEVAAWRGGRRLAPTWAAASPADSPAVKLRERGVYWITGGLGGLGRQLALYLARRVRARLVLKIGRASCRERGQDAGV